MDALWEITISKYLEELLAVHAKSDMEYARLLAKRKECEAVFDGASQRTDTNIGRLIEVITEISLAEYELIYLQGLKDGARALKVLGIQ